MAITLSFTKPSLPSFSGKVRRADQLLAQINPMSVNASAAITDQTPIVAFTGFTGARGTVAPAAAASTGCLKINVQSTVSVGGRLDIYDWAVFDCNTSAGAVGDAVFIDAAAPGSLDFAGTKRVGEVVSVATVADGGKILVSPGNY